MRAGKWVQELSRGWTIYVEIMLGAGSELGGYACGERDPFSYTL